MITTKAIEKIILQNIVHISAEYCKKTYHTVSAFFRYKK